MGLVDIEAGIKAAAEASGRGAQNVHLIAVSKVQPANRVDSVLESGHRVFGENRVQEAQGKWPGFREKYGAVEVHLIGPLQSNKVRAAMELFDVIHTVDRIKLARTIARIAGEMGECPDLFVQVNTGEEPQKAGVMPSALAEVMAECRALSLPVIGLMCIPPAGEDPVPHFKMLGEMAKTHGVDGLSMGMSGDYETAIACGATHVRVGSAIFGERGLG